MLHAHVTTRCPSQPPTHMMQDDLRRSHNDVPQPPTSLVTAPPLTVDIYVGLEMVCAPNITFRWGAAHRVDNIELGLGQCSSFRPWLELTPFEQSIALGWARDVILEHHASDLPLTRFGDWWALPRTYYSTCADMSPEPALMARGWSGRDQALSLAKTIYSWAPPVSTQDIGPCTGSAAIPCSASGSGTVTREWHGDRSSDTDGDYSDSDSDN